MMIDHLILMHKVCKAYPTEWPTLVEVLEYLYDTAPRGPHGLSARDLSCAYAIAHPLDRQLAPFRVPKGAPETDEAARLFDSFRELYGL